MRATMSLVQAWLAGIGVFIAMTAAFFVALVFAIAGPPTSEEMSGVRAASASALRGLSGALKRAGEDLCQAIPGTVGADEFCPAGDTVQTAEAHAPAAAPVVPVSDAPDAPSRAAVVSEVSAAAPPAPDDPSLLGAPDGATVMPIATPVHIVRQPARRTGASVRHARRATAHARPAVQHRPPVRVTPRQPIQRAQVAPADALPAPDTATLIHVQPAPERVIAPPPEAPRQDEAPVVTDPVPNKDKL